MAEVVALPLLRLLADGLRAAAHLHGEARRGKAVQQLAKRWKRAGHESHVGAPPERRVCGAHTKTRPVDLGGGSQELPVLAVLGLQLEHDGVVPARAVFQDQRHDPGVVVHHDAG